jgi:glycosyltransferase involved in cell wall biosynthesis
MVPQDPVSTTAPLISVVIGVYNHWAPLDQCLRSLAQQLDAPSFEVIVVDDGSTEAAPEFICIWSRSFPLTIVRQPHVGISAARNSGVQHSRGSLLLFVDADCRLKMDCLAALFSTVSKSSQHDYFQLHLVGDRSSLVGKAEELRLMTLQNHLLQPDGRIRYLNTAGFAMRRTRADIAVGVFNPAALRAEDTLLLAKMMRDGGLPLFVDKASVQHAPPLSLLACLRKDIWTASLEGRTYEMIAAMGVRVRVSNTERLTMLRSMWKSSGRPTIGRSAWFVLVIRQALRVTRSFAYRVFRGRASSQISTNSF